MTLFQMYELANYIANKDYEGNVITPEQFQVLANAANLDMLKIKMGLPEDFRPGQPISRQYLDVTKVITDQTRFLKVYEKDAAVTSGVLEYPSNYLTYDVIRYNYQREIDGQLNVIPKKVEILTESDLSDRLESFVKRPTVVDPVAVVRGDGFHVYPEIIAVVDFVYVKYPASPVFQYNVFPGYITEKEDGTVQFEWPESLHNDLVRIIMSYIGINIRDQQLYAYAESKKEQGV